MSGALWTAAEAAAATGGAPRGDWAVSGVGIDSRGLASGELFVALRAARDGHLFVAAALAAGAGAAMVSRVPEDVPADAPLLLVADVQAALEALGRAGRARTAAKVIAVTGSVGKTTVKEMLRHALAPQAAVSAAQSSYNNHWGVPLTLARAPRDAGALIVEVGMNAPGEIAPLARMARPDVGVVTTVAAAHLEAFGRIEGIAEEKGSLAEGVPAGGTVVLNGDLPTTPILRAAAAGRRVVLFGEGAGNDVRVRGVEAADAGVRCTVDLPGGPVALRLGAPGRHLAVNGAAVLAAVHAAGFDAAAAAEALAGWRPHAGRGTREAVALPGGPITLIDDAFNANPASLGAALEVLAGAPGRRRVAVLGDMLELGPDGPAMHAAVAGHPAMARVDVVHTSGSLMRHLHDALPPGRQGRHFAGAGEAAAAVASHLEPGDAVLVKGSKGSAVSRVVDAIRALGQSGASQGPGPSAGGGS